LWHKGATSGNTQAVTAIFYDCDGDTLLLKVTPAGPACHTGAQSCFFRKAELPPSFSGKEKVWEPVKYNPNPQNHKMNFITTLTQLIEDRKHNPKPGSYTNQLLQNPVKAAQKVGEEATEVVIAALAQNDDRLLDESADLVYHTLVLLSARNLTWEQVVQRLEERH
jgi:phosphoribosyl-ATP pyrophosphohydrolase/phosphoribosyl-AMP cyclohydrolase